jgi:hypothetical protein
VCSSFRHFLGILPPIEGILTRQRGKRYSSGLFGT